ncbi:MAG: SPASM domain-containing protein, partial [bacterium]|nr:SPASM domain-containing protein [bacterium]
MDNIKQSADILKIHVRVNVDKENANDMGGFFRIWKEEGLSKKVPFYFGQVQANTTGCSDISSQCYTTKEYSHSVLKLISDAKKCGVGNIKYPTLIKMGYCTADNVNGYVVAPSGKLFKCWEEVSGGDGEAIGNLLSTEQMPEHIMNTAKYLNWAPFLNEDCNACNILTICVGGCLNNGLKSLDK